MNVEQSRLMFMAWLKTCYPDLYSQALTMTLNASPFDSSSNDFLVPQELGSYSDNYVDQNGINSGVGLGSVSDWTTAFSDLLKNVGSVATQYMTTRAEVDQVKLNIDRVNRGQPPVNPNGTIMTVDQLRAAGYTEASITQIEAGMSRSGSIFSGGSGVPLWAWGLGAAGVLLLVLRKR